MALSFGAPADTISQTVTQEHVTTVVPRDGTGEVIAASIQRIGTKTTTSTTAYAATTTAPALSGDAVRITVTASNEDFAKVSTEEEAYS